MSPVPGAPEIKVSRIDIRTIEGADPDIMAQAFAGIGWAESKPVSLFQRYLGEHTAGQRVVLLAFLAGEFAGYVTVNWLPDYPPARSEGLPEIQDLNTLPRFRRRRVASALLDQAEAIAARRSGSVAIGVGLHPGYNAAQRMYGLRGYVPDGCGLTYRDTFVPENALVTLDNDLVLHFVKRL